MTQLRVDTDYRLDHFLQGPLLPDVEYLFRRVSDATVAEVSALPLGRVLDVGSGPSHEMRRLAELGWQTYAVDPSAHVLGIGARDGARVGLARAIGERLPFADRSMDAVVCQMALDHFTDRHAFIAEAARIIRPGGRLVVSLNNFEGLACTLGRALHPLARASRLHHCSDWPCWSIPRDHTFKGDWHVVRSLGGRSFLLERAYGVSLLCMFYGWGHLLRRLPEGLAGRLLEIADGLARERPEWSDVIVSVWRPAR